MINEHKELRALLMGMIEAYSNYLATVYSIMEKLDMVLSLSLLKHSSEAWALIQVAIKILNAFGKSYAEY